MLLISTPAFSSNTYIHLSYLYSYSSRLGIDLKSRFSLDLKVLLVGPLGPPLSLLLLDLRLN